jgi:hypothetical protein
MPYTVQFVGLVCFYREAGGRQALLPDGREPGDGIEPHVATIEVAREDVLAASGWEENADTKHGRYLLPPCSIELEGADLEQPVPGALDTSHHDRFIPRLTDSDPNFEIDPDRAETIARLRLRRGVLAAYRIPGGEATISQLDVPQHDGEINVKVIPRDGSPERRLRLKPGTEVLIANMGQSGCLKRTHDSHFKIYAKLSTRPVTLHEPKEIPAVPWSKSQHALFTRNAAPINLTTDCTNTGCCP